MHRGVIGLTLSLLYFWEAQGDTNDYYRAAVVDYEPTPMTGQPMDEYALTNAAKMMPIVQKAKAQQADIIVFPETGLFSTDSTYFVHVPDPRENVIPAGNASYAPVLRALSDTANLYSIYIAVNLHENYTADGETFKYNTEVVFDRNGTVVARYRKYHLFDETGIDTPKTPQYEYFDTDFGVRFGLFICFDILYSQPAMGLVQWYNITHFVYSSAWFNELPLLTSIQTQNAFAFGNDVVVLGSGLNHINNLHEGSGIYRGRNGKPLTYLNNRNGTTLLIADVPKTVGNNSAVDYSNDYIDDSDTQFDDGYLIVPAENITLDYTSQQILPEYNASTSSEFLASPSGTIIGTQKTFSINQQLCHSNLCCNFNATLVNRYLKQDQLPTPISGQVHTLSGYLYYRFVIANGVRNFAVPDSISGQQVCGIISCVNSSVTSCALPVTGPLSNPTVQDSSLGTLYLNSTSFSSVKINGNFSNQNVLATISTLSSPDRQYGIGKLINYTNVDFTSQNLSDYLNLTLQFSESRLVTGGIFVRTFNLDEGTNGGTASIKPSVLIQSTCLTAGAIAALSQFTVTIW